MAKAKQQKAWQRTTRHVKVLNRFATEYRRRLSTGNTYPAQVVVAHAGV